MDVIDIYLEEHPFLVPLIEEARAAVEKHFPGCPTSLRLTFCPESDDRWLVLWIIFTGTGKAAFDQLGQLDEAWWLEAMPRAQGKFHLNVEFQ